MDVDGVDFNSELEQIEREINRCKPTLQSRRDECENIETEICDVRQLQRKARFVLDNVRSEEENLQERFKNIRLNYEACVEKADGHEDPNETICVRINELMTQRKELLEELTRMKRKADDNGKKLARVRAMIVEQEVGNFNARPINRESIFTIVIFHYFIGKECDTDSRIEGDI